MAKKIIKILFVAAAMAASWNVQASYRALDGAVAEPAASEQPVRQDNAEAYKRNSQAGGYSSAAAITDEITLREIINDIKLVFFLFMAISVGLIAFQIAGYRYYMKRIDKKWSGWFMFAPLWAFVIWISIIIGIIIGGRYMLY